MVLLKDSERLSLDLKDQGRRNVALIWLEECSRVGTTKQHKLWKRSECLTKCFHNFSDSELALLFVDPVKGTAKAALDILAVNDAVRSRGLEMVWQILHQAKLVGDKFREASEKLTSGSQVRPGSC